MHAALIISSRYPADIRDAYSYYVAVSTEVVDSSVFHFMPVGDGYLAQVIHNNADRRAEGMRASTPRTFLLSVHACTCLNAT